MTEFYPAKRFPASEAVRALGLEPALATRLARHLDRAIARGSLTRPSLRETVCEAAMALRLAGMPASEVVWRLERTVIEHAHERGWTETSLVTGQPRFATAASQVAGWASRACGPSAGSGQAAGRASAAEAQYDVRAAL